MEISLVKQGEESDCGRHWFGAQWRGETMKDRLVERLRETVVRVVWYGERVSVLAMLFLPSIHRK